MSNLVLECPIRSWNVQNGFLIQFWTTFKFGLPIAWEVTQRYRDRFMKIGQKRSKMLRNAFLAKVGILIGPRMYKSLSLSIYQLAPFNSDHQFIPHFPRSIPNNFPNRSSNRLRTNLQSGTDSWKIQKSISDTNQQILFNLQPNFYQSEIRSTNRLQSNLQSGTE